MSVSKTWDDGTFSIFTMDGITVHKEQDVLITCKGKVILIGVWDDQGRYSIPLIQQKGQWQPWKPWPQINTTLHNANNIYDLPSAEQAIRWMHALCGYPIKSTWIKAVKAGNFIGWPLLNEKNVQKYYHENNETNMGHMNRHVKMFAHQTEANTFWRNWYNVSEWSEDPRYLCQSIQCTWNHFYRSNWMLSYQIPLREPIIW